MIWMITLSLYFISISAKIDKRFSILYDLDTNTNTYDIKKWTETLDIEECAIVEIGEEFCSIFVERSYAPLKELFLGICPCDTLYKWSLCDSKLAASRPDDCVFRETPEIVISGARVHRRLCNIGELAKATSQKRPPCDCSLKLAGQNLYQVKGFPTCFLSPLPDAICSPRSVCGVAQCFPKTHNHIHGVECDPNCYQQQPFCEELGITTSTPRKIDSQWSNWSEPKCNSTCGEGNLISISWCLDNKKNKAIDCIHKSEDCCRKNEPKCKCKISRKSNGLMLVKEIAPCQHLPECDSLKYKSDNSGPNVYFDSQQTDDFNYYECEYDENEMYNN